ncbi:MAG: hypothetical protein PHC99_10070 [Methylococcales bacterium]|nr:hypothetical protein [Methylococcales bacterium]
MRATKKQINDFLKSHNLQADDLLAHRSCLEIRTAYKWAKVVLGTKHMKWGFYNVKDFKEMYRIEPNDPCIMTATTGQMFLLNG